jgi:predicted RNase H-like nuclease (RuvC/YqgF family)
VLPQRHPDLAQFEADQKLALLTSQSDKISALKAENSQLLVKVQEDGDEFAKLRRRIAKLKAQFQETEPISKRLAASKADRDKPID